MKISKLIFNLIIIRLKGYRYIDFLDSFLFNQKYPPADLCYFYFSNCNFDKSVTLSVSKIPEGF